MDFKLRSISRDGRRKVLRRIPGLIAFDVDEKRIVWMDDSEGGCSWNTDRAGVVWVAPLVGGAAKRVLGREVCATSMWLAGDDVFWTTELGSLWWANLRTGLHMVVAGDCSRVRGLALSDQWVYVETDSTPKGGRRILRVPWWR